MMFANLWDTIFSLVPMFSVILSNKCHLILKIVVVPDSSAEQKVPAIDGLLEYRKDKQELYLRSNNTWNVLPQENKVQLKIAVITQLIE